MSSNPAAGWYPDQHGLDRLHYWDGSAWTGQTRPAPHPDAEDTVPLSYRSPTQEPDPVSPRPDGTTRLAVAPPDAPWHTRWWVVGGAALVVGLLVGAAITGGQDLGSAADPAARPAAVPSARVTVTETAGPSAGPSASASAGATASASGAPYSGTDDTTATFAMTDEIGKYLQDAQDDLQSVSGKAFFYTGSTDATGQGRAQILDSDWRVCTQSVAPGTPVSVDDRSISFGVVKLDEDCP